MTRSVLACAVAVALIVPGTWTTSSAGASGGGGVEPPSFVHLSNASSYDGVGFFAQDALFDDMGADSGGDASNTLTGFEGDAYINGHWSGVGDIRSVRVLPVAGNPDAVRVLVTMNSLHVTTSRAYIGPPVREPGDPVAGAVTKRLHSVVFVGVDDRDGGFGAWPYGAMLSTPGIDRGYTLTFDGFGSLALGGDPLPVAFAEDGHTLSVVVDGLASSAPRLVVGAGEWDSSGGRWKAQLGSPRPVLDLAMSCPRWLRPELPSHARDDTACEWGQAADLAAAEAAHSFFTVDLTRLGEHVPPPPPSEGYVSYVFRSAVDNGDGYYFFYGNPQILGPWQNFTVAVPAGWDAAPKQMVVFLHGAGSWMTLATALDGWSNTVHSSGRILLFANGRGPAGWSLGAGEADVLEAMAAAETILKVDPERRVLSGLSAGGYGTWRIGLAHPDLFAGLILYMSTNDNEYSRNSGDESLPLESTNHILANAYNLPVLMLSGPEQTFHEMWDRRAALDDLEYQHDFRLFADAVHYPDFPEIANGHAVAWLDVLGPRVTRPRTVVYRLVPGWLEAAADDPYRSADGVVGHDGAYWVSDVEARPGAAEAEVVATSEAIAADGSRTTTSYGPEILPGPAASYPAVVRLGRAVSHDAGVVAQRATVVARGVAALTLDLAAMGLVSGATITVTTDGPMTLWVAGGLVCGGASCAIPAGTTTIALA